MKIIKLVNETEKLLQLMCMVDQDPNDWLQKFGETLDAINEWYEKEAGYNPEIYAWDYRFARGNTLKEKYKTLYEMVKALCLKQDNSTEKIFVIADETVVAALCACILDEHFEAIYETLQSGAIHVANIKRTCGGNMHAEGIGYNTNFKLYQSDEIAENKIILVSGEKVKFIKLFNTIGD